MLFKKQICSFLAFFLLLSQLGLAFNVHFYDNKVASVSINASFNTYETEKKCCGEVEKDSKCCHNKIIKLVEKPETVFLKSLGFSPEYLVSSILWKPIETNYEISYVSKKSHSYFCDANAPPIYKLNCQLVFYA